MTHRRFVLLFVPVCLIAVPLPGCGVPVTEPLSDPDKAEPDKQVLGKWLKGGDETQPCEIDSPAVKGNPKGLMRAVYDGRADDPKKAFWFFTTTIAKDTYATIYLDPRHELEFADFRKEGTFEKLNKGNDRRYFIFRYVLDGDKLTVDGGDKESMKKLMEAEKIKGMPYFKTPPGWVATYLEQSGPQTLYNGTNVQEWRRPKK